MSLMGRKLRQLVQIQIGYEYVSGEVFFIYKRYSGAFTFIKYIV